MDSVNIFTDYKLTTNLVNPIGNYSTNYSWNARLFGTALNALKLYKVSLTDNSIKNTIDNYEKNYLAYGNSIAILTAANFSFNMRTNRVSDQIDIASSSIALVAG